MFSSFIKNLKKPVCLNCKYLVEVKYTHYDGIPEQKLARCAKFGEQHFVTGKVEYDTAVSCRQDVKKCGENALFFSPKITVR